MKRNGKRDASRFTREEFKAAVHELINKGLIVCTSGVPGADGATYALTWLPLDSPDRYPQFVQRLHEYQMRQLRGGNT